MRAALMLVVLAACDPIWGVHAQIRDPNSRPVEDATVAVACPDGSDSYGSMAVHTDQTGAAQLGGLGSIFPVGCDIFIAKPGFKTQRIRYSDICPAGANDCKRVFDYDLILEPL